MLFYRFSDCSSRFIQLDTTSKLHFITVTEALKTSNIKTVLFILRTIDTERKAIVQGMSPRIYPQPQTLVLHPHDVSVSAVSRQAVTITDL
jgi:hypothetical protein